MTAEAYGDAGYGALARAPLQIEHVDRRHRQLGGKGDGQQAQNDDHTEGVAFAVSAGQNEGEG